MKKTLLLLVTMLMAFALIATACGADEGAPADENTDVADASWDNIVEKGYFIVGLDDEFPPMGFRDENNEIVGFDIDMAKAAAEYLGVEVQFQPVVWDTVTLSLTTGEIDCIWNGLSITEEREEAFDFSNAYTKSSQIVVTMADSDIASFADLAGKTVGTQMASASLDAIATQPEVKDTFGELKEYDTFVSAMMDLENGRIDAVVIDSIAFYGDFNVKSPDKFKALEENFGEELYAIGVRTEDDAFTAQLNDALAAIIADGTAAEISNKWFGEDILIK